jgi:hypothetical protein
MSRLPHVLDSWLTDGGESVQAAHVPSQEESWSSTARGRIDPRAIVQLEGLGQSKNRMTSIIEPETIQLVA